MRARLELDVLAQAARIPDGRLDLRAILVPLDPLRCRTLLRLLPSTILLPLLRSNRVPAPHELPEPLHVLARDDLVLDAAEHEDGHARGDERELRGAVPLLVAQERERAEQRQRGRHEARQAKEGVLEDERAYREGVPACEVDGDGAADGLAVEDLRRRMRHHVLGGG